MPARYLWFHALGCPGLGLPARADVMGWRQGFCLVASSTGLSVCGREQRLPCPTLSFGSIVCGAGDRETWSLPSQRSD